MSKYEDGLTGSKPKVAVKVIAVFELEAEKKKCKPIPSVFGGGLAT